VILAQVGSMCSCLVRLLDHRAADRLDGSWTRALLAFYARRMRRPLPAALLVLVVTAAIWTAVAGSVERDPISPEVRFRTR
jgi:peptidoglycan/LPS O-acetylase OafA/YrhL